MFFPPRRFAGLPRLTDRTCIQQISIPISPPKGEILVPATQILWGQVVTVFGIALLTIWTATEWTAWRLGFQPELGRPWFEILHFPFYLPPAHYARRANFKQTV